MTVREAGAADGFALMVMRDEGLWQVTLLPEALMDDLDGLVAALRQQPPAFQPIVLVDVDDEFFVALRLQRDATPRALLSDITAAADFDLAEDVLDLLDEDAPDDSDEVWPAGDLAIFADLGLPEQELAAVVEDLDLYADEMLLAVARRLGFADQYTAALGLTPR